MPRYHIWTIGCQMNKAESERLGSILEQKGFRAHDTADEADLIVVNSCVVRQSAENRVINRLAALKHLKKRRPGVTVALTGCFVGSDEAALRKAFPHVDHFFRPGDFPAWLDDIKSHDALPLHPPVSVYVPIMQGCNNFCSYCIVPFRRGRERSRPLADIVAEVRELGCRGAREVILLGQNVDSYGHDLADSPDLADLLDALHGIESVLRLRFLTSHPKDMSRRLIDRVASLDKVCEHINLPLQAGDDDILEAMRRGYTVDHYRRLVSEIRELVPGVALSTDVIVGFPGETDGQFQHTVELLTELRFDMVHAACYSPRAGTYAARQLADDVPAAEKSRRLQQVELLQERIVSEINGEWLGGVAEVLVEGKTKGKWRGRTRGDKLVFFAAAGEYAGKLVDVGIDRTSPWSLQGHAQPSACASQEGR